MVSEVGSYGRCQKWDPMAGVRSGILWQASDCKRQDSWIFPNMTCGPNGRYASNSIEAPLDLAQRESLDKLTLYCTVWARRQKVF